MRCWHLASKSVESVESVDTHFGLLADPDSDFAVEESVDTHSRKVWTPI
jgi:hypothetical protein